MSAIYFEFRIAPSRFHKVNLEPNQEPRKILWLFGEKVADPLRHPDMIFDFKHLTSTLGHPRSD